MRSNKINHMDLFTQIANTNYKKHIKTQSKRGFEMIDRLINWDSLMAPIESSLSHADRGRKPFSLKLIVKCFILQTIYSLSDPRLEEEIADPSDCRTGRRSFQIFQGLSSGDSIPDETTICRYRELFSKYRLDKKLFASFNSQLRDAGMILEKGSIVDASIKEAYTTHRSKRDQDARFTSRGKKPYHGCKAHIGIDHQNKIIHSTEFTPANVHDSDMFDHLLTGKEQVVIANKGYANKNRKRHLRQAGIFCGILDKGYRNRLLSSKQKKKNYNLSQIRSTVERPFAFAKQILHYDRCRYYNLARNRLQFNMIALVYNMRRCMSLTPCPL